MAGKTEEIPGFDDLLRAMVMAASTAAFDARRAGKTPIDITDDTVRAALACALGNGLIEIVTQQRWPRWVAVDPPYKPTVRFDQDPTCQENTPMPEETIGEAKIPADVLTTGAQGVRQTLQAIGVDPDDPGTSGWTTAECVAYEVLAAVLDGRRLVDEPPHKQEGT